MFRVQGILMSLGGSHELSVYSAICPANARKFPRYDAVSLCSCRPMQSAASWEKMGECSIRKLSFGVQL